MEKHVTTMTHLNEQLRDARKREEDSRVDAEAARTLVKELETSLEAIRLSKDLEIKRHRDLLDVRKLNCQSM